MIRLGVSLPALMQLLGHKDIRMTMRYVQVIQRDLQREFHVARQNAVQRHQLPELPVSSRLLAECHASFRARWFHADTARSERHA
jgi:hypothetical protein